MSRTETPTREVQRKANILRAVRMREAGSSYRAIATALEVDVKTAYTYVWAHFDELKRDAVESLEKQRHLELVRIDRYMKKLESVIASHNPEVRVKGILASVKLGERRAKLIGLDMPIKQEVTTIETVKPGETAEQVEAKLLAALEKVREQKEARH